jgi:hypothetical protein
MIEAQLTEHVHSLASAAGRLSALPQHPMSPLRIVFLVVLVLFFCSLFIGSYIWMRRPSFGQLEGGRGNARGAQTPEGMAEGQIRTVPSDPRAPR